MQITFERVVIIPALVLAVLFFGYKIYQNRKRIGIPILTKLLIGLSLIFISSLSALLKPISLWSNLLSVIGLQYGFLLYYFGIKQLFANNSRKPYSRKGLIREPSFIIVTITVLVLTILAFQLNGNYAPFVDGGPYIPTFSYYADHLLSYACLLYLITLIVKLHWESLRYYKEPSYLARRIICMLGFLVAALNMALVEVNLLFSVFFGDTYRAALNQVYQTSKPLIFFLIAISYIFPQPFLVNGLQPFLDHLRQQKQREQALLEHLHEKMVQIVPAVQLNCSQVYELHRLIEISDARQFIRSHYPCRGRFTPKEEAAQILDLTQNNVILPQLGPYIPPPTSQIDIIKYNLSVAKYLKQLEASTDYHQSSQAG